MSCDLSKRYKSDKGVVNGFGIRYSNDDDDDDVGYLKINRYDTKGMIDNYLCIDNNNPNNPNSPCTSDQESQIYSENNFLELLNDNKSIRIQNFNKDS